MFNYTSKNEIIQEEVIEQLLKPRFQDVSLLFSLIEHLEDSDKTLVSQKRLYDFLSKKIGSPNSAYISIDAKTDNILKASAILLLYNLIEAGIDKVYKIIVQIINESNLTFREVNASLQYKLTQDLTKKDLKKVIQDNDNVSLAESFKGSGNLDAKKIDEFIDSFGMKSTHESGFDNSAMRAAIREIKEQRNNLAHGNQSFNQVGRSFDFVGDSIEKDLKFCLKACMELWITILKSVEDYIEGKKYRA
jgi:hypothetical protein